jgi:hypothetical protein
VCGVAGVLLVLVDFQAVLGLQQGRHEEKSTASLSVSGRLTTVLDRSSV